MLVRSSKPSLTLHFTMKQMFGPCLQKFCPHLLWACDCQWPTDLSPSERRKIPGLLRAEVRNISQTSLLTLTLKIFFLNEQKLTRKTVQEKCAESRLSVNFGHSPSCISSVSPKWTAETDRPLLNVCHGFWGNHEFPSLRELSCSSYG